MGKNTIRGIGWAHAGHGDVSGWTIGKGGAARRCQNMHLMFGIKERKGWCSGSSQ